MKIALLILLIVFELPFVIKFKQAQKNFDIIRQTAILLIMLILGLLFAVIYKFVL